MLKQAFAFTAMVSMMYVVIMLAYRCYEPHDVIELIERYSVSKPVMRDFPPVEEETKEEPEVEETKEEPEVEEIPLVFACPTIDGDYDEECPVSKPVKKEVKVYEGTLEDLRGMGDWDTSTVTK